MKKLADKRQDGFTVNCRIDTRVECLAEMHVYLRLLPHRRFWVNKFANSHSHDLLSLDKSITFTLTKHIDQKLAETL